MGIPNYQGAPFDGPEWIVGANGEVDVRIYNDTGSAISNGAIYMLAFEVDATDTSNPIIKAIPKAAATQATESNLLVVINNTTSAATIANGAYGLARFKGPVQALVDGTTDVAVGDQLEILNSATSFIQGAAATAGDSGALVPEAVAIALEAMTSSTPANKWVYMIGRQAQVKGS